MGASKQYAIQTNQTANDANERARVEHSHNGEFDNLPRAKIVTNEGNGLYTVALLDDSGNPGDNIEHIRSFLGITDYEADTRVHLKYDRPDALPYIFDAGGGSFFGSSGTLQTRRDLGISGTRE